MKRVSAFLVCFLFWNAPLWAEQQEGLYWLGRVVTAAQKLNYVGTFSYRNGGIEETSRITHRFVAGGEQERLEVLDGSPRELIRNNDEVKCYLPESHTLIIDKRAQRRTFPALLPASLSSLTEYYLIRKGPLGRVAEHETQIIYLEPKDDLRYGQQLWIDVNSGLLLKSSLLNERNQPIETFAFTQLQIGGTIEPEVLKSKYHAQSSKWRVQQVHAVDSRAEDALWQFNAELPGFRKLTNLKRQTRSEGTESLHMVFSDGLAAISVFIEALPEKPDLGMVSMGAINVYRRAVGKHLLVVMGETPPATVKRLGDGIEPKRK
jgi:sigma-E factor negative regulatory protein RseB